MRDFPAILLARELVRGWVGGFEADVGQGVRGVLSFLSFFDGAPSTRECLLGSLHHEGDEACRSDKTNDGEAL